MTVERALYGLCLATAAGLRFHDLGDAPLGSIEAANSWPAWAAATGSSSGTDLPTAEPPTSALLFSLQWLVFWLKGSGDDVLARSLPAAAGSALVLLPWSLRHVIGRVAALSLAALLAIDPVLVALSRMATGEILSALFGVLTLVCLIRLASDSPESDPWRRGAAVSAGLLMVSGTEAWSLLLLLGVTAVLAPLSVALRVRGPNPRYTTGCFLGTAGITAVIAATTGFVQWQGLAYVSTGLTAWVEQWIPDRAIVAALGQLLRGLVREQPLLLVLALACFVLAWRQPVSRSLCIVILVTLASTAIASIRGATLSSRLPLTLALAVLAASAIQAAVLEWPRDGRWGLVLRCVSALAVAGLCIVTFRCSVRWSGSDAAHPGVRDLARDVAALSAWQAGDAGSSPVNVVADPWPDPLLAWHLRDLTRLKWVLSPPSEAPHAGFSPLIITPAGPDRGEHTVIELVGLSGYVGSRYPIRRQASARESVILWVARE
jgi:hypothetical protein